MKDEFKECCKTCRNRLEIKKYDYSKGGCVHSDPGGYICLAFSDEGIGVWMYGLVVGMCECYAPNEDKDQTK